MQHHYTVAEAAKLLEVERRTIVRMINACKIRVRYVGRQMRIPKKDIDEILEP